MINCSLRNTNRFHLTHFSCLMIQMKWVHTPHGHVSFVLILLPVSAPVVECQDELSLHLLQEEAQAPGVHYQGSYCFPSPPAPPLPGPPNLVNGPGGQPGVDGNGMPRWRCLAPTDAPPIRASCCFRALFPSSCHYCA